MATEIWKEEVQYIKDTPIRIVIDDQISVNRGRLMPHWHDEVEIDFVLKGSLYYTVNGVTYNLSQGDVVVVDSGVIHSGRCRDGRMVEETRAEVMTLQINKDVFHYANYPIPSFEVFITREDNGDLRAILLEIKSVFEQKKDYYEMLLNSNVLRLCYCLMADHSLQEKNSSRNINPTNREIKKALKYIEDHCLEKVALEDVAEYLNYNVSYFSRSFHQFTGFTFKEYLNRCRCTRAANMLGETDKNISEISFECGFPNVGSFITFFKRQYHLTPEQYRKANYKKH